jgi:choline dehydrogenase
MHYFQTNAVILAPDPNYLGDPRDLSAITNAIIKTNQIFDNAKAYPSKLWHLNVLPGIFFNSRKSIENTIDYIRNFATTYYHPCGTCRMAINQHDRNAVVDEDLRVIGVNKLRVADASVICHIPNVPIAKLCMVIGVAAAERLTNEHKR